MSCSAGVEPTMLHNVIVAPSTSSSDHWCVLQEGKGGGKNSELQRGRGAYNAPQRHRGALNVLQRPLVCITRGEGGRKKQ